jgi:hypothetical protein
MVVVNIITPRSKGMLDGKEFLLLDSIVEFSAL